MRRVLSLLLALGLGVTVVRPASLFISGDVPTTESATATTFLPSQAVRYTSSPSYAIALTVAGSPTLDAIHKMDSPGHWLFSVEAANNLGGALGGADADPRDVIRLDGTTSTYSFFFCGAAVGVPSYANVDALYLDGADGSDIVVSFDVPTTIGAFTFDAADLVRFVPTGPVPPCGNWALAGVNPEFDASAAGFGVLGTVNLIGADRGPGSGTARPFLLAFDVPADVGPPAATYVPGQIVSWNGAAFALAEPLNGWPIASGVDGLSGPANPGKVPATITVTKTALPQLDTSDVILDWSASCSAAEDYGIYEGALGTWYSHSLKDCSDGGVLLTEQVTPGAGDRYFLVVARSSDEEGSYGTCTLVAPAIAAGCNAGTGERPVGTAQCATPQVITACPP